MTPIPEAYVHFLAPLGSREHLARALKRLGYAAYLTPPRAGYVVACIADTECDALAAAEDCSRTLGVPILVVGCDLDTFSFWLIEGHRRTGAYHSAEVAWDVADAVAIAACRSNARQVCAAFGKPAAVPYMQDVLLQPERFCSPSAQHAALVEVLGLPAWSVGAGYNSLREGILPVGLSPADLFEVPID
jgi:hypothetical protein